MLKILSYLTSGGNNVSQQSFHPLHEWTKQDVHLQVSSLGTWEVTSATPAPSSSALAGRKIRCVTLEQMKPCQTESLLSLVWDKKVQDVLPVLQPKWALYTGFNFLGFQ